MCQETLGPRKQEPKGRRRARGWYTSKQRNRRLRKGMGWFKSVEREWRSEDGSDSWGAGRISSPSDS